MGFGIYSRSRDWCCRFISFLRTVSYILFYYKFSFRPNVSIHFISYGDRAFSKSRKRIETEAIRSRIFSSVKIYTEDDKHRLLSELKVQEETRAIAVQPRGGGYWIWKPLCVYERLGEINEGDVLVYADAGSEVKTGFLAKRVLRILINRLLESDSDVLCFRNGFMERQWSKRDVFEHSYPEAFRDLHGIQLTANRFLVVKSARSLEHFDEWQRCALENPRLFDDSRSHSKNANEFIANRHDQSVFSLISKRRDSLQLDFSDIDKVVIASKIRE